MFLKQEVEEKNRTKLIKFLSLKKELMHEEALKTVDPPPQDKLEDVNNYLYRQTFSS